MRRPKRFGTLLKRAIRKIALMEDKNIAIVQDELGFALGRDTGGVSIQFWERGNIPPQREDVELLRRELSRQGGLTPEEAVQFVAYAGFPELGEETAAAFIAGPPLTHPRHFFGRDYELTRLFGLWRQTAVPMQNAALIGPRGCGKTSLLLYLQQIHRVPAGELRPGQRRDWLPGAEGYRWAFVDFRNPLLGTRAGLLRYLLTALDLPVPAPCDLERFVEVVSAELKAPAVVLMDEIRVALERYNELDDTFWDGLRALASLLVEGNLAFVLSARDYPNRLAQRHNRSSDFFSLFAYTAVLGPFNESEALALIDSSPHPFPKSDVDWILQQSRCWPILVQILCRERLVTLEGGDNGPAWRAEGERQLEPFRYLLE